MSFPQQTNWRWPDGEPFDARRCLFVAPPEQIGRVLMASSSLPEAQLWRKALSPLGFRFRHTLGYLGTEGFACFECEGSPKHLIRREQLLFSEATNLFLRRSASSSEFIWKDHLDRLLFRFELTHPHDAPQDHIIHLLRAAETHWTARVLNTMMATVQRGGSVEFPVLGEGSFRLGPNYLSLGQQQFPLESFESLRSAPSRLVLLPTAVAEAGGLQPVELNRAAVGNADALEHLLRSFFQLPLAN